MGSPISIPKSPLLTKSTNSSPRKSPKYRMVQVSPSKSGSIDNLNHQNDLGEIPPLEPIEEVEEDKLEEDISHKSELDDVPKVSSCTSNNRDIRATRNSAKDNKHTHKLSTDDVLVYLSRWQTTVVFLLIAFLLGSARIYILTHSNEAQSFPSSNLTFPKSWSSVFAPQASIEKVKIYMKHQTINQSEMPQPSSSSARRGNSSTGNNGGSLYPLVPAKSTPWKKFISFLRKLSSLPNNLLRGIFQAFRH